MNSTRNLSCIKRKRIATTMPRPALLLHQPTVVVLLIWTTLTVLVFHHCLESTSAFVVPTFTSTAKRNTRLAVTSDKPSRQDMEERATASSSSSSLSPGASGENPAQGEIQGLVAPPVPTTTTATTSYADSITHSDDLRQAMFRLTQTRAYPLFLLEKATKYILDDFIIKTANSLLSLASTTTADNSLQTTTTTKERLVILGAGWGAAALLQDIDNNRYDVTVISPRNHFVFTPMLAGASVGTVDVRSITQPIREFNLQANYLEAAASCIDPIQQTVSCTGIVCDDVCEMQEFKVPYDRLVIGVGAQINTFGIPGVAEFCYSLKQIDDAIRIRRKIINLLERANMPNTSEAQLHELLTFCIIGAGPTGVEFAGELRDFLEEDGPKYYPHLLQYVQIKVIEATPVVLRPFDQALQQAAVDALTRKVSSKQQELFPTEMLQVAVNQKVAAVTENEIRLQDGSSIPYGLAVWAGGIGPLPITQDIIATLGGQQVAAQEQARGKIAIDPWLRALEGRGRIFALGDCTWSQNNALPATAQVAAQQGEYLAHILSAGDLSTVMDENVLLPPKRVETKQKLMDTVTAVATGNSEYLAPFQFLDLGILAYTGRFSAIGQLQVAPNEKARVKARGTVGFGLWRSVYLLKQASTRNRVLVFFDWIKTQMFGRDVTSIN